MWCGNRDECEMLLNWSSWSGWWWVEAGGSSTVLVVAVTRMARCFWMCWWSYWWWSTRTWCMMHHNSNTNNLENRKHWIILWDSSGSITMTTWLLLKQTKSWGIIDYRTQNYAWYVQKEECRCGSSRISVHNMDATTILLLSTVGLPRRIKNNNN